ncbi:MAG: FlgD immunoglobulin-like domain containing protein [Candidatus Krumholzibacteriia bacterium]
MPAVAGGIARLDPARAAFLADLQRARHAGDLTAVAALRAELREDRPTLPVPDPPPEPPRVVKVDRPVAASKLIGSDLQVNAPHRPASGPVLDVGEDGTLYLACARTDEPSRMDVYRSLDSGDSWTLWYFVVFSGGRVYPTSMAVAEGLQPTGRKLLIALAHVHDFVSDVWMHSWDLDDGSHFVSAIASGATFGQADLCVDYPQYTMNWWGYAVMDVCVGGSTTIAFATTADGGETWSSPSVLASYTGECNQREPEIDYGHGNLYVAHARPTGYWQADLEVIRSRDLGSNWDAPVVLRSGVSPYCSPAVAAAHGSSFAVVAYHMWYDARWDIDAAVTGDGGGSWSTSFPPFRYDADETIPALAAALHSDLIVAAYFRESGCLVTTTTGPGTTPGWTPDFQTASPGWVLSWDPGPAVALNPSLGDRIETAWTDGRGSEAVGVWYDWFPTGTTAAPEVPLAGTMLLPNRPNPFNPATTIVFVLAEDGPVRLDIHDGAGRRVRTLRTGRASAGRHEATWDGRDAAGRAVASGAYHVRLQAGGERHARPLTLVR